MGDAWIKRLDDEAWLGANIFGKPKVMCCRTYLPLFKGIRFQIEKKHLTLHTESKCVLS